MLNFVDYEMRASNSMFCLGSLKDSKASQMQTLTLLNMIALGRGTNMVAPTESTNMAIDEKQKPYELDVQPNP